MKTGWIDFRAVKEQADFRQVLERYGLDLKERGDELVGLCPFHRDTKPSFRVNLEKKVFHCFGCSAKGNILDFVARKEGVTIRAAAELLARWCGLEGDIKTATPAEIVAPRGVGAPAERAEVAKPVEDTPEARNGLGKETSKTAEVVAADGGNKPLTFSLKLDPSHPYLAERGLTPETVKAFGLGYCSRGVMKGRIAIPIHDMEGALVAYAGRWPGEPPEGEPKYRLPEGFKKSLVVFNLYRYPPFRPDTHKQKPILIVEGYWSVFWLHQLGYPAVALMGKELSKEQEVLIAETLEHVIVMMDGDGAGREAQEKIVSRLARRLYVRAVELPDGSQPDTLPEAGLKNLLSILS